MPLIPGAVLAALLQSLMGLGYGYYLSRMGTHSAYQASLSVIAITKMTLYLFSIAVLVGAELNQQIGVRRVLLYTVHREPRVHVAVTAEMVACERGAPPRRAPSGGARTSEALRSSTA
jgi:uncharacterized BrkB/YihY/UPF0761 family membrane protein